MTLEQFAVFIGSSLRLAAPILFGATGEIVSEKAGVLNMSIEGMMLTGALGGALGSLLTGNAMFGLCCGILAVLPVALLQAFLSNTLRVNQIVSGIGINILALGATTLAYREVFGARSDQLVQGFATWSLPLLGDIPIIGKPVFDQVWILYLAIVLIAAVALIMNYTSIGLAIRAAGVEPAAANNAGVPVTLVRYGAVLFAGLCCALGGVFISLGNIHTFTEGMTSGAGYLAITAVIFGNWRLWRMVAACLLFGAATALQFQLPAIGINVPTALLIMSPYLLAFLAVTGLVGRQTPPGALTEPYRPGTK
jgi:general nucleoside transport system permease protein